MYGIGWGEMATRGVPYVKFSRYIYLGTELPPISERQKCYPVLSGLGVVL